jgi:hypothetical protein
MRRIFVPFRQSVIAFRLQIGLSICALIALGVMPPSVIHPPGGTSIAEDEAPWLQRYTFIAILRQLPDKGACSFVGKERNRPQ